MTTIIVSQPTFKPYLRLNEGYMKDIGKILKKGYPLISRKKIKRQELNQFLLAMAVNTKDSKYKKLEKKIQKRQEQHRSLVKKLLYRQFRKDPELKNSKEVFFNLEKLYNSKFEGTRLAEKLSEQAAAKIEKLIEKGEFIFYENSDRKSLILLEGTVQFEGNGNQGSEEIIDELVLTVFGREHVKLIEEQIQKMDRTLAKVIEKVSKYISEFTQIANESKKEQIIELSSVFLGKILGIREPLNLSKKQLARYVTLREEIVEEAESPIGQRLLQLYDQWYDVERLRRAISIAEALENTISDNVDQLRDLHRSIEEAEVKGIEGQAVIEFIGFAIDTYGAFEEFRLVTEAFQDIPSFTTLKGGLIEDVEEGGYEIPEDVVIYADTVFKSFQQMNHTVYALRGIDLQVKKGEFLAIMGPSGSGKTTLLNILSGLDRPERGKVIVNGIDMGAASERTLVKFRRNTASFIYQSYNLLPVLTSLENVRLPSDFGTDNKIGNKTKRAMELLAGVGLERFAKTSPKNLSGGQQQRVTIARSLQNMPKIVFADEPTGDLDHKTGDQIMKILSNINKELGVTLLVVTHDRRVAEMADRIVYMQDGKVIKEEITKKV